MIKFFTLTVAIIFSLPVVAGELMESDTGTYVVLDQNHAATDMFYRLSKNKEKWIMEGKKPGGSWNNISCDAECNYRQTNESEIQTYFPSDWREHADISCIQNVAQAFCHYTVKGDATKGGYLVVALVTGRPIPIFVRRVPS